MLKKALIPAAMILLMSLPAYAGLVQVDTDGNTTIISGGMIKEMSKGDSYYTILDAKKGNFTLVNTAKRLYASDTIDNFCRSVAASMEQAMKGMSKEERAVIEKMRGGKKDAPRVSVRKAGDGGTIAGYSTVKYEVMADGRPYQELWLTSDGAIMKEAGDLYSAVMKRVEGCMTAGASAMGGAAHAVENAPEYRKIAATGWEMKSVTHSDMGMESKSEVVKLERKNIPASEFSVPAGYRKAPLLQVMFQE